MGLRVLCVLFAGVVLAHGQEARWDQLSTQVVQLMNDGNYLAALGLAEQARQVAQSTWGPNDVHVAVTAAVLGNINLGLEKYADAEASLKQAVAIYTKLEGPEGKHTANALSSLGTAYQKQANYPAAEQAVRQALAIEEKQEGENSDGVATSSNNLALILRDEDKYTDAEPFYKKAIAIDSRLGSTADAASSLDGLGTLYLSMHKYSDAEQAYEQAITLDMKVPATDHPHTGLAIADLATAYQDEGKFAESEQTYGKGLVLMEKENPPDLVGIATAEQDVGTLFRDEGKYPQAEALLVQALTNTAKVLGPYHPDVAVILDNLGDLYDFEARYSDADRALNQALAIDMKTVGPESLTTAIIMADLARLHGFHGDYGMADEYFQHAIPVYMKVLGQSDPRVADVIDNAALVLLLERKYEEARQGFTLAAAIYQKAQGSNSAGFAECLDQLADIAEDGQSHDLAEKLHKQALAILEKTAAPDSSVVSEAELGLARDYKDQLKFADAEPLYLAHLRAEQAHPQGNITRVANAEENMAGLYFAWDKPAQAEPYFQMFLKNRMDEFRANAATMSERDRLIYLAGFYDDLPLFYSFVLKYHAQMPELTGEMYDEVLAEKGLIAQSATAMRAAVAASGDQQAVAMFDKLASDKEQVAALSNSATGDPANHQQQLNQVAIEASTLEGELLRRSAVLTQLKTQNAATWKDVQKTLKPSETAVEFVRFAYGDGIALTSEMVYVALVVTPDCSEPAFVALGTAKQLETGPMLAYRDGVGQTRGFEAEPAPAAAGQQGSVANTNAAYAAFWKPLEAALEGAKRVYVSPDGVLDTIPMGLMADSDGKLLMEKIQLRIVNSTKDLLLPARGAQTRNALVVGNPKFELTAAQQKTAIAELRGGARGGATQQSAAPAAQVSNAGAAQFASRGGDLKGGDLPPLPGTQVEVDTVDKLLKAAGWQATEYTGELALKDAVAQAHAPRVVHIATHGYFLSDEELKANAAAEGKTANVNEDPMLRSGLFFAGADRVRQGEAPEAGVDDGVLTAYEASQLNLEGTELVVLSACETGLGKELNIDGVFGLRRGLQEAGAEAVMMSMWSVPDKETQELMAFFYQKWLGGMEKPEALRQAQLEERETVKKRYGKDLPFYWGAFVLIGR
ncbi:MAG: CHAT domain-containing tetratricopeptide repeat protein [Terracidiphilus sp.]